MNSFTFAGKVTFEEYLECHKILAAKRRAWIRGIVLVYGVGMIGASFLITHAQYPMRFLCFGILLLAYAIVLSPLQFKFRVKRNWNNYPAIHKAFEVTVNTEGVTSIDDKEEPVLTAWENFMRFKETENLFLLYFSPLLPLVLPKRILSDQSQLDACRDFLSQVSFESVAEAEAEALTP